MQLARLSMRSMNHGEQQRRIASCTQRIHLVVQGSRRPIMTVFCVFDDSQRLFYVIPGAGRLCTIAPCRRSPYCGNRGYPNFLLEQINARMNLEKPLRPQTSLRSAVVRPLAESEEDLTTGDQRVDSLSRRHEVECDAQRSVVTVFGGKLTDCLNVGAEVASEIESLGVPLEADERNGTGSPILRVG